MIRTARRTMAPLAAALVAVLAVPALAAEIDPGYATTVGARDVAADGAGVGIALLDTGVRPSPAFGERLLPGVDVTGDRQDNGRTDDGYGHGTFVAGVAAGREHGVAPGAHVVPVKVGGDDGQLVLEDLLDGLLYVRDNHAALDVDVVVVAAAVQVDGLAQAVVHRLVDDLTDEGLLVVAAAGNTAGRVLSPADAPQALAVGSTDTANAVLSDFSATSGSKPEVAAPGERLVGVRAPGSVLDEANPQARFGTDGFVGTGTSASVGVVAGAAAVLIQAHPDWTPAQVAGAVTSAGARLQGTRAVALDVASAAELARVTGHERAGSVTPLAGRWNGQVWQGAWWAGNSWAGNSWAGNSWAGNSWAGNSWAGSSWAGSSWAGSSWAGSSWA